MQCGSRVRRSRPRRDAPAGRRGGLDDSDRDDEGIIAAWGAYDGERLVGAIALERLGELDTVNWLAVDEGYRRRGIAAAPLRPRWSARRGARACAACG